MKSTGIVRKLDELGRITLPIELRRNFDVNERDPLEIFVDDDKIILNLPLADSPVFCCHLHCIFSGIPLIQINCHMLIQRHLQK